jgi:dTDP-4-dehydrorhamnose reductase
MNKYASIILTGGNGMLAHALRRAAAARGHRFVALSRDECDITIDTHRRQLFDRHQPTLLLNCAAHTKVDVCETDQERALLLNGHAPGLLATLCKQQGTCLVHYSTDFVFDGKQNRPYREDDPATPLSVYGQSKRLGEEAIQRVDPPDYLILRTAWLYGRPGQCFPRTMIEHAQRGKPLKVVNDQHGTPTLTDDLAAATFDLLDRNAKGLFHVTNSGSTTWFDFTAAALEEFGISTSLTPITSADWKAIRPDSAPRPANSTLDLSKLQRAIGRPMRDWREALRDYRQQVQSRGF